ncbi:MAG: helix-turn-helix transcriptional regulator [Synechococcales cyanobacterium K44_A2020_017]|nr:helix-turn-helix transcriptional regulator [Synechococcales cyanobacterium K32_A2020_035]MBF2095165.1 helix-turn-helix transcriptional regulator [Synechococcales cyanobacterium K44_A2020_017]
MLAVLNTPLLRSQPSSHPQAVQPERAERSPHRQPQDLDDLAFFQAVLEGFMDGVVLVTSTGKVLHTNRAAQRLFQQASNSTHTENPGLPPCIWHLCQWAIAYHNDYPQDEQHLILEAEVLLNEQVNVRARVRWLSGLRHHDACLLVTLEDLTQVAQQLAIAAMHQYGLTPREAEVWQYRLQGYSYQQMAQELHISENTVKKHIKNILSKRRSVQPD